MIGKIVIVRSIKAGVFFGTLDSKTGDEVTMSDVRNLWYYSGANSLMDLAEKGVKKPLDCKFTRVVESLTVLDVVQIIPCTNDAIVNLKAVPVWKQ